MNLLCKKESYSILFIGILALNLLLLNINDLMLKFLLGDVIVFIFVSLAYFFLKSRRIPLLFGVAVAIYFISYIYPAFIYQNKDFILSVFMFKEDFLLSGIFNFSNFFFSFLLGYLIVVRFLKLKPTGNTGGPAIGFSKFSVIHLYMVAFVFIGLLIFGIGDINVLLYPEERFVGKYLYLISFSFVVLNLILMLGYSKYLRGEVSFSFIVILFFSIIIYPMAISSRSVIIPVIVLLIVDYFSLKHFVRQLVWVFLISMLYICALVGRGEIGLYNFMITFVKGFSYILELPLFLAHTVSGLGTLTLALDGLSFGHIVIIPNPMLFILYISPIPSKFLPLDLIHAYQSLTFHYGFNMGLNADIVTESIFWLGRLGPVIIGMCLGIICSIIDKMNVIKKNDILPKLLCFAMIYFLLLSNIASMRAASRPVVYVLVGYFLLKYMPNFYKKCLPATLFSLKS